MAEDIFTLPASNVAAVPRERSQLWICSSKLTDLPSIRTCTAVWCCYQYASFL